MNKKLAATIIFFLAVSTFSQSSLSQNTEKKPKVKPAQPTKTTKELADELFLTPEELRQKQKNERLRGFNSLYLSADIGLDIQLNGLTLENVKNDVEIKLRQAGFKIETRIINDLWISANAFELREQLGILVYSIRIEFRQNASLDRDKSVKVPAIVWDRSSFGTVPTSKTNLLREIIKDYVDEFILDYLKANESVRINTSIPKAESDSRVTTNTADLFERPSPVKTEPDSPFTATYVGGNRPPEVEVFNVTDRTLYIDLGQGTMTAYTIPSGQSKTIQLIDGNYNYKATAPRVSPLQGKEDFKRGYRYTWRFKIITVKK
jgi:hypothetical protein